MNAVRRSQSIELDKNVLKRCSGISSLANPGGSERRELGDGRLAERGRELGSDGGEDAATTTGQRMRTILVEYSAPELCKPCTDTDWANEKKPPSAHDDDWTDLV